MSRTVFFYLWWTSLSLVQALISLDFAAAVAGERVRARAPLWLALAPALALVSCRWHTPGLSAVFVLLWLALAGLGTDVGRAGLFASGAVVFTLCTFTEGFSALVMSWCSRTLSSAGAGAGLQALASAGGAAMFFLGLRFFRLRCLDALRASDAACLRVLLPSCALAVLGLRWGLSLDGGFERRLLALGDGGALFALCLMLAALAVFFASAESFSRLHRLDAAAAFGALGRRRYAALRHDLNNHMLVLSGLLGEGRCDDARRYAGQLSAPEREPEVYTGSASADVLLSAKKRLAAEAGIDFKCALRVPEDFGVSEPELCALLGNILDNAINACRREPGPLREIRLYSRTRHGMWLLEAVNTCTAAGEIRPGTGLANIRAVAERHSGAVETQKAGGVFRISVLLCAGEK